MYLDYWDECGGTVWNWKDERTGGGSQLFKSKREALDAWRAETLVFDAVGVDEYYAPRSVGAVPR